MKVQVLDHLVGNDDGVFGSPRLRGVPENAEFNGEMRPSILDVGVHPAGVCLEKAVLPRTGNLKGFFGCIAQPEDSLLAVDLQRIFAKNLRQFAGSIAAHDIHLPEAVLCCDVALREEEIRQRRGIDCRHAVAVARHGHRRGQAAHLKPSIHSRERAFGNVERISA